MITVDIRLLLLTAASFGPHISVSPPIRLFNFVLYLLAAFALFRSSCARGISLRKSNFPEILLSIILISLVFSTLYSDINLEWERIIATFERVFCVLVAIFVLNSFGVPGSTTSLEIMSVFVFMLCLNTVLQLYQVFVGDIVFIQRYWFANKYELSTAIAAAGNGRFLGIFNQPLELGFYTGLGFIFICGRSISNSRLLNSFAFVLLAIGGMISVSKVFLVLGLGLGLFAFIFIRKNTLTTLIWPALFGVFLIAILPIAFSNWAGYDYINRFFDVENYNNIIEFGTAGRFGSETTDVMSNFAEVWRFAPIFGFGLGSIRRLDNGFLEFFYQGGLVSLALYLWLMFQVFLKLSRTNSANPDIKIAIVFLVYIFLSSIGAPVLTMWAAVLPIWAVLLSGLYSSSAPRSTSHIL